MSGLPLVCDNSGGDGGFPCQSLGIPDGGVGVVPHNSALKLRYNRVLSWELPGHGEDCGKVGGGYRACPSQKHYVRYKFSCSQRDCPRHHRDWLKLEARRSSYRISKLWMPGTVLQEVIIAFPSAIPPKTTDEATAQRELVYWILKFLGVDGGLDVFHDRRIRKHGRHPHSQNIHHHALCQGRIDPELVCGLYEQYGIIVKGLGRTRNVRKKIEYMLSHCAIPTVVTNPANNEKYGNIIHVTHWFGSWSYNKNRIPDMPKMMFCPGCRAEFRELDWFRIHFIGSDPPPGKWGELKGLDWRAVDEREYTTRSWVLG